MISAAHGWIVIFSIVCEWVVNVKEKPSGVTTFFLINYFDNFFSYSFSVCLRAFHCLLQSLPTSGGAWKTPLSCQTMALYLLQNILLQQSVCTMQLYLEHRFTLYKELFFKFFHSNFWLKLVQHFLEYRQRPSTQLKVKLLPTAISHHSCTFCLLRDLRQFVTNNSSVCLSSKWSKATICSTCLKFMISKILSSTIDRCWTTTKFVELRDFARVVIHASAYLSTYFIFQPVWRF